MKKVLFVATLVKWHINMFHKPFIKWFHDQGWQVDVAAKNDYINKADCVIPYCDHFYNLPFERSPMRAGNLEAYRQLKKLLEKEHYDLIHCHTPMGSVVTRLAAMDTRKHGTKVIYTAHGFHFYKGAPAINWLVYYPVEWLLAHKTDMIITMNAEDFANAKKFKAKRVEKVHGVGVDLKEYAVPTQEEKNDVRRKLGLGEKDICAISVAQLIKRKNHIVLIHAVAKLKNPHLHLFICGEGVQEAELKAETKKLGVEENVHFLGQRTDIGVLLKGADMFLLATLQEGLPKAIMEAMASGVPIIASKVRGNIDLIDRGKGGYLVDARNVDGFARAIQKVTNMNQNQLKKMEQYNLKKVQNYRQDVVVEEMAALYRSMM